MTTQNAETKKATKKTAAKKASAPALNNFAFGAALDVAEQTCITRHTEASENIKQHINVQANETKAHAAQFRMELVAKLRKDGIKDYIEQRAIGGLEWLVPTDGSNVRNMIKNVVNLAMVGTGQKTALVSEVARVLQQIEDEKTYSLEEMREIMKKHGQNPMQTNNAVRALHYMGFLVDESASKYPPMIPKHSMGHFVFRLKKTNKDYANMLAVAKAGRYALVK